MIATEWCCGKSFLSTTQWADKVRGGNNIGEFPSFCFCIFYFYFFWIKYKVTDGNKSCNLAFSVQHTVTFLAVNYAGTPDVNCVDLEFIKLKIMFSAFFTFVWKLLFLHEWRSQIPSTCNTFLQFTKLSDTWSLTL